MSASSAMDADASEGGAEAFSHYVHSAEASLKQAKQRASSEQLVNEDTGAVGVSGVRAEASRLPFFARSAWTPPRTHHSHAPSLSRADLAIPQSRLVQAHSPRRVVQPGRELRDFHCQLHILFRLTLAW